MVHDDDEHMAHGLVVRGCLEGGVWTNGDWGDRSSQVEMPRPYPLVFSLPSSFLFYSPIPPVFFSSKSYIFPFSYFQYQTVPRWSSYNADMVHKMGGRCRQTNGSLEIHTNKYMMDIWFTQRVMNRILEENKCIPVLEQTFGSLLFSHTSMSANSLSCKWSRAGRRGP